MTRSKGILSGVVAVLAMMAVWVWTGCEEAGNTSGISINPSVATLGSGSSNSTSGLVLTALVSDSLALPLKWSVGNSGLGYIASASGSNATYVANAGKLGDNIITVRDQYDNTASAVVTQK